MESLKRLAFGQNTSAETLAHGLSRDWVISRLSSENKKLAQQVGLLNWRLGRLRGEGVSDSVQDHEGLRREGPSTDSIEERGCH